jgi:hypothetical protein
MSKHLVLVALLSAACATGGGLGSEQDTGPHARPPNVELTAAADDTRAVFPRAIEPQLPSADRIARQIRDNLGDDALVSLALCVATDGRVTKVAMLDGSNYGPFDAAVLTDAKSWHFDALPGPDNLQTCERVRVKYIAPR